MISAIISIIIGLYLLLTLNIMAILPAFGLALGADAIIKFNKNKLPKKVMWLGIVGVFLNAVVFILLFIHRAIN